MIIKIKNLKRDKMINPWDVRIDRNFSILGNPFFMKNESERDKVCDKYKLLFNTLVNSQTDSVFISSLNDLKDKLIIYEQLNLFCWCASNRCHGETIKVYLEDNLTKIFK